MFLPPTNYLTRQSNPRPNSRRYGQAYTGNAIVEYLLIGAGILVVSVGALTLLGNNLNNIMGMLRGGMKNQIQASSNANAQHLAAMNSFTASLSSHTGTNAAAAAAAAATASISPSAQGPVTQTAGGNGTTETYAQTISDSAKKALADGSISQAEYDLIVQTSNKGHDIAAIQGLLEGAYKSSSGNASAYAGSQLNFKGQNYTPAQLNDLLKTNVADFSSLKTQASAQTGVLNNQSLLITLNDSGTAIINNTYSTQQQNQTADSYIQYQNAGTTTGGSADTNQQSATICTAGQHLDANNHCTY